MVDKIIEVDFEDLSEINFPLGRFGLIVNYHDIKYEFLFNLLENSEKVIALGSGALGQNTKWDRSRPRFSRWSWDFGYSTINYNDPTFYLDDEILTGWGIGTEKTWFLKDISKIFLSIIDNLNIQRNNLIFLGSAAGGFTALMLSILIKKSISIAEIPQLDVTNWGRGHWIATKKHCFEGLSEEEILLNYNYRLKVIDLIKKERYVPRCFCIFGLSDEVTMSSQLIPFLKDLSETTYYSKINYIKVFLHGKTDGHDVLKKSDFFKIFNEIDTILKSDIYHDLFLNNTLNNYYVNKDGGTYLNYFEGKLILINGQTGKYFRLNRNMVELSKLKNEKITFEVECSFESGNVRLTIFEKNKIDGQYELLHGEWINESGLASVSKYVSSDVVDLIFQVDTSHIPTGDGVCIQSIRIYKV